METIAYYAFWSGMVSTAVALAAGLTYALIPRLAIRSAVTNVGTVQVPVVVAGPFVAKENAIPRGHAGRGPSGFGRLRNDLDPDARP